MVSKLDMAGSKWSGRSMDVRVTTLTKRKEWLCNMYNVIIIDDEPWSIISTKNSFNWSKYNFQLIAEITNSHDAIKLVCNEKIDVAFVDIRMPEVSGLQLIETIRSKEIDIEFVIISGFSEFSYAKNALRYSVFDYLLKPINLDEAENLLKRLVNHLVEKQSFATDTLSSLGYNSNNEDDSPYLNESFKNLLNYVTQNYNQELYLKELVEEYHINFTYCSELFNKTIGKTFTQYVLSLRMAKASELLLNTNLTIDEISHLLGYNDYHYFICIFKKYFNYTPSLYRKKYYSNMF